MIRPQADVHIVDQNSQALDSNSAIQIIILNVKILNIKKTWSGWVEKKDPNICFL